MAKIHRGFLCVGILAVAFMLTSRAAISAKEGWTADQMSVPFPAPASEQQLIEELRSGAPEAKVLACKQLAIYGGKAAVPELAKLLIDERFSSWARIALEAIPDPACDEALRTAVDELDGKLLVGTINSIGVRRDANAVEQLTGRLKDRDAEVASAAAVALGRIGNDTATRSLRDALAGAAPAVRASVAEGCILCAERLMHDGKTQEAAEIYDEVRQADVPKPRIIEATRGATLARGSDGVPLLIEQLNSSDKGLFQIGLSTVRELSGRGVSDALAGELGRAAPERAALLLGALADRDDFVVSPAVLNAAKTGDSRLRAAAIDVIGRSGDASSIDTLLDIAIGEEAELKERAKTALASLQAENVDSEIVTRLRSANGKARPVLIEVIGARRIDATADLVKALNDSDPATRTAALTALGETVGPDDLSVLILQVIEPKSATDALVAGRALKAASVRMPDREACAAELAAVLPKASMEAKVILLETLGAMGGAKALETIAAAMKSGDAELQDTGSRLLGEWMTVDAGPVLLDLAKNESGDKYKVRALRGYIRLARQFAMPDSDRAKMCQYALEAASRPEEQKLVLAVLERYPSIDTLRVAASASRTPELREDATRVAMVIADKVGGQGAEAKQALAQIGFQPVDVEIIKAEYGAGTTQKDVTETLRQEAGDLPLITLSSPSYNDSFGGDPVPGTAKRLKVHYRINGKAGDASFPENAAIVLPMPE